MDNRFSPEAIAVCDDYQILRQAVRQHRLPTKLSAIDRLVDLGGPKAVDILRNVLHDREIRRAVYSAMPKIVGLSYEELLFDLNESKQQHVAIIAARALGLLGDKRAIPYLLKGFDKPPTSDMKEAVIFSLGLLKDVDSLKLIIDHLEYKNWKVSTAAARSLGEIGDKRAVDALISALDSNKLAIRNRQDREDAPRFKQEILRALGAIGDKRAIPAIVKTFDDRQLKEVAKEVLIQFGPDSYDSLIELLNREDPDISSYAARELGQLGNIRATDHLMKRLDCEWWVPIFDALEVLQNESIAEPIIDRIRIEPDSQKLEQLIRILGGIADSEILPQLVSLHSDKRWRRKLNLRAKLLAIILGLDPTLVDRIIRELISEYLQQPEKVQKNSVVWMKQQFRETMELFIPENVGAAFEKLLLLDHAINWYTQLNQLEEAARVRKLQAEMGAAKVSQKVVQGDEITSIQDSVVNRSTVGSGAGDELIVQLERLGDMKEKGLLSDEEFTKAKEKLLR